MAFLRFTSPMGGYSLDPRQDPLGRSLSFFPDDTQDLLQRSLGPRSALPSCFFYWVGGRFDPGLISISTIFIGGGGKKKKIKKIFLLLLLFSFFFLWGGVFLVWVPFFFCLALFFSGLSELLR